MLESYGRAQVDRTGDARSSTLGGEKMKQPLQERFEPRAWHAKKNSATGRHTGAPRSLRGIRGLILWGGNCFFARKKKLVPTAVVADRMSGILKMLSTARALAKPLTDLLEEILASPQDSEPAVWQISLNGSTTPALADRYQPSRPMPQGPSSASIAARSLGRSSIPVLTAIALDCGMRAERRAASREALISAVSQGIKSEQLETRHPESEPRRVAPARVSAQ